jgi:hypothetical protein
VLFTADIGIIKVECVFILCINMSMVSTFIAKNIEEQVESLFLKLNSSNINNFFLLPKRKCVNSIKKFTHVRKVASMIQEKFTA